MDHRQPGTVPRGLTSGAPVAAIGSKPNASGPSNLHHSSSRLAAAHHPVAVSRLDLSRPTAVPASSEYTGT